MRSAIDSLTPPPVSGRNNGHDAVRALSRELAAGEGEEPAMRSLASAERGGQRRTSASGARGARALRRRDAEHWCVAAAGGWRSGDGDRDRAGARAPGGRPDGGRGRSGVAEWGARAGDGGGNTEARPSGSGAAATVRAPPSIEQTSDAYRSFYGQLADATFDLTHDRDSWRSSVRDGGRWRRIWRRSRRAAGRPTLLMDTDFGCSRWRR